MQTQFASSSSLDHLPSARRGSNKKLVISFVTLTLVSITAISSIYSYYSLLAVLMTSNTSSSTKISSSQLKHHIIEPIKIIKVVVEEMKSENEYGSGCDIFRGEWVPNPNGPYYTNETCWAIHEHQNCAKFGRPDAEFMKWRWKPNGCDLPIFNPAQFLEIVRGKSLAFVGDSVARNHMQSLICLLNRVTYAVDVSPTSDEKSKRWSYPTHNFTLANFWSPYLVQSEEADPRGPTLTGLFNLHLDVPDPTWASFIEPFDYVILSAGHWFFRPTMYYHNNTLAGCHYCQSPNIPDLTMYHGYRMAFRTAFRALDTMPGFKGRVFLRTYAPSHFENGEWDKGGDCVRIRPWKSNETRLEGINLEMYMTQLEEFRAARRSGLGGLRLKLMDTTEAMLMRPDGHPSRYGHRADEKVVLYNDCVHWCLPGPVDAWNDMLLEILKRNGGRLLYGSTDEIPQTIIAST